MEMESKDEDDFTDPFEQIDSDNDGLGDNMDTDDDNDGISDIDEYAAGTDHLDADTDDDGLSDQEESEAGTNLILQTPMGLA